MRKSGMLKNDRSQSALEHEMRAIQLIQTKLQNEWREDENEKKQKNLRDKLLLAKERKDNELKNEKKKLPTEIKCTSATTEWASRKNRGRK